MHRLKLVPLIAACAAVSACTRSAEAPMAAAASAPSAVAALEAPGGWLGRWQGPEGTFLEITGGPGTHSVAVQNLDGPRRFDAKAGTDTLVFTRDGVLETVRAGSGPQTGMKWLAEKRDCLIVKVGEGYCRD